MENNSLEQLIQLKFSLEKEINILQENHEKLEFRKQINNNKIAGFGPRRDDAGSESRGQIDQEKKSGNLREVSSAFYAQAARPDGHTAPFIAGLFAARR